MKLSIAALLALVAGLLLLSLPKIVNLSRKLRIWPQFRGPNRDNRCTETGLLKEWPKEGPKLLWNSKEVNGGKGIGKGFSSVSVAEGKVFTMGDRQGKGSGNRPGRRHWQRIVVQRYH